MRLLILPSITFIFLLLSLPSTYCEDIHEGVYSTNGVIPPTNHKTECLNKFKVPFKYFDDNRSFIFMRSSLGYALDGVTVDSDEKSKSNDIVVQHLILDHNEKSNVVLHPGYLSRFNIKKHIPYILLRIMMNLLY